MTKERDYLTSLQVIDGNNIILSSLCSSPDTIDIPFKTRPDNKFYESHIDN